MPPYSPSSTTTWKRCPVLWTLGREGIVRREISKRDTAAALGAAFAQAMHVYHRCRQAGVEPGTAPLQAAEGLWRAQQAAWVSAGRVVPETQQGAVAALWGHCARLAQYVMDHPLPPEWQVVAVDQPLPDHGYARPDLVMRKPSGDLVVIDYKTTLTLGRTASERTRKLGYRVAEWRDSDQLYHYAWAVGATHVMIVLCEVEPVLKVTMHDFWFERERIEHWARLQEAAWAAMAEHARVGGPIWRAAVHTDQFGTCEYYDWCYGAEVEREGLYTIQPRGSV